MENHIRIGYASRAAAGELDENGTEICGDTVFSCRLPDGSRAVILCDGMGHGKDAAAESRAAAGLLRRLLKQGMPSARAIKEVNRSLLQKSSQKEIYATVDLAVIGQSDRRAKFYKMGAASSYIIRGRRIRRISQPALPVGILPEIRLTHVSARLAAGDIIVMMSDGICDSGWSCPDGWCCSDGVDWVESFLDDLISDVREGRKHALPGPRQLAAALLARAQERNRGAEMDDATVAVILVR
jgi:stage II sporulation protein E